MESVKSSVLDSFFCTSKRGGPQAGSQVGRNMLLSPNEALQLTPASPAQLSLGVG
jgi:hypothetical protein